MKEKSKRSRSRIKGAAETEVPSLPRRSLLDYFQTGQDRYAVERLMVEKPGTLKLDSFAIHLKSGGVPALRNALISAYLSAAAGRRSLRAAKPQLDKARAARLSILKSISHLGKARFAQERGFGDVFGLPLSDPDAKFESGELGLTCWTVQRHLTQLMETLTDAINRESRKRVTNGRTQERLRTLIDKLADWWESLGKSIAPNIDAVRRGDPLKGKKEPAYIYGRTGEFLELAVSVFSEIDVFKPKRIETVLTHAYKARLKARNSAKLKQKKIT